MTVTPNESRTGYVLELSELSHGEIERAGAKAANLGELARAGFLVPDGFVLTTDAFGRFLAANAINPDSSSEAVAAAPLPADIADALLAAAASFGDVPLAVRSSGVAEDLPGASFAGQYETVLDVRGAEALVAAVRRCWASAFSQRVATYGAAQGQRGAGGMAVLVQRLVPAEAAGVAFSANPVTGERTESVVSAVRGLGERLVSGQASPDEWLVKGNDAVCQRAPEGAIDAARARAVADLARRVEAHFGCPQDIEWAVALGKVFLLQARPITALPEPIPAPIPVPVEPPPGFWQREASHAPQPHSPMNRSVIFAPRNAALKHSFDESGLLLETVEMREIGGWEYTRLVPLGGKDRPAPPAWLMPLLIRVVPQMRSRIKQCVEAIRSDRPGRFIRRWYEEWRPGLTARIAELRDIDLAVLSDSRLDDHVSKVTALLSESADVHFLLHGPLALTQGDLVFTCRDLLGWDERQTFEMLSGLSEKSTEPARRLAELARMARERPTIRNLLERVDEGTVSRLAEANDEFAVAFAAYQWEFGCRALRYEVADPTVAETPALILGLIRDQIVRGYDPAAVASALEQKRAAVVADARATLAGRSAKERERFERVLARAEQSYPVREDNEFYTLSAPLALVRYVVLELGHRLADRGMIAQREDVFFLEMEEARAALREGGDQHALVARRKAERAWVEVHPGPASYGKDPGPPPSFAALPPEARLAMEVLLWYTDRIFAPEQSEQEQAVGATTVRGISASPGQYTGPVRVIMSEAEFYKLQAGDVLVCPITSPVWSVLFPSIGALVTDTGGILSHPAIIAREYQVPAVVAAGNATHLLRDGQIVTVDGSAGWVEVRS
ncbi:MAG: PEP/pyruvate-binding domain-containing protein [Gemmatimonadales bacterium]